MSRGRNLVVRADGREINVVRKTGHLFVCSDACCCGRVDSGNPPVPLKQLQAEWENRKIRNQVHLTTGGCLGPCELANVAMLLFAGQSLWLHSFHTPEQVTALYDHIDAMLAADAFLPTPPALEPYEFNGFDWGSAGAATGHAATPEVSLG
jgi:cobaltochelatase CobN